jgi:DNA-binding phage protein
LTDPCRRVRDLSLEVCEESPEFLQGLQFVLAIAGIAVAVLLAALTLFQAASGRRVPRLRTVLALLAALGIAWGVVLVIGLLAI